jgi:hypothetical protein
MQLAHDAFRIDQPVRNGSGTSRNVAESTGHSSRTPNSGQTISANLDQVSSPATLFHDFPIAISPSRAGVTINMKSG